MRMVNSFNVGHYKVKVWALGTMGPGPRRISGHWSVFDIAPESGNPVAKGRCAEERSSGGQAIDDAMAAGRHAAETLLAKEAGVGAVPPVPRA